MDLENPSHECLWLWLRPHRLPRHLTGLICCVLYNPPDTPVNEQKELTAYLIDQIDRVRCTHPDCGVVLLGDFNNLDISDLLCHHNLTQIVDTPTREGNILDLIVTNLEASYSKHVIIAPLGSSDHNIVKWSVKTNVLRTDNKTIKKNIRSFPMSACAAFGRWCCSREWFSDAESKNSASALASSFTNELNSAVDRLFPSKVIRIHNSDKPWMTPALKKLIYQRQKAFHSGNLDLWRHYRLKVRNDIGVKKRAYYTNKVQHLKSSDSRKWWDCVNQMSGKKRSATNNIKIVKNGTTLSGKDLAQSLNTYFLSVSNDLSPLNPLLLPAYLPAPRPVPKIFPDEVCTKMLNTKVFKSSGPDNIPNRIIKDFAYELAEPVCHIFNTSLSTGEFPNIWKDALITPIPKTPSVSCEEELRPISLTASLSKILEDFVVNWMVDDVKHKINPQQFGCLKGTSTTFCLIDMINNWLRTLDDKSSYLRIVFLDFSKAFDRIDHNILVPKLLALGVRLSLIPWICSFLSNRRQSVKIDNFQSDWGINNAGVPQGTKLGPILFIIMINDLELASSSTDHWKYVDDVTISESLKKNEVSVLQSDLNTIERWTVNNNMKLNGKKCKEMIVSFVRSENDIPRLLIDGLPLDLVPSFKILGLTMNNKLKWQDNTEALVKKASKRLYIIRVLQRCGLPPNDLLLVYFSMVRSILEYACPVWHTMLPKCLGDKIEKVQKRAFRIIYPTTDYEDALNIAQCKRLDDRRNELCAKTFKKILKPDAHLNHLLPPLREESHELDLRNNSNFTLTKCRTERFKTSFIPAMTANFNSK